MVNESTVTYALAKQIENASKAKLLTDYKDEPVARMMMAHASKHSEKGEGKPDLTLRVGNYLIIIEVKYLFKQHVEQGGSNPATSSLSMDLSLEEAASKAENGAMNYLLKGIKSGVDFVKYGVTNVFFVGISMDSEDELLGRTFLVSGTKHYVVRMPQFASASTYFTPKNLAKVVSRADRYKDLGTKPLDEEIAVLDKLFRKLVRKPIDSYSTEIGLFLCSKLHWTSAIRPSENYDHWVYILEDFMKAFTEYCGGGNDLAYQVINDIRDPEDDILRPIPFKELSECVDNDLMVPETVYGRLWADMFHPTSLNVSRMMETMLTPDLKKRVYDTSYGQCIASSRIVFKWFDEKCMEPGEHFVAMVSKDDRFKPDKIASMMLFGMGSIRMEFNDSKQRDKAAILISDQSECPSVTEQMGSVIRSVRCLVEGGTALFALGMECVKSPSMAEQRIALDKDLKLDMAVKAKGFYILRFTKERNRSGSKKVKLVDVSNRRSIDVIQGILRDLPSDECYERSLPDGKWFTAKETGSKGVATRKTPAKTTGTEKKQTSATKKATPAKKTTSNSKGTSTKKSTGTAKKATTTKKTSGTAKKPSSTGRSTGTKTGGTARKTSSTTKKAPAKRTNTRK